MDGDPRTAWQFGDFSRAVGQSLELTFTSPRAVPAVSVQVRRGAVQISKVRLEAGGQSVELAVDAAGRASWTPARPVRAGSVRLTVLETTGDGFGLVGVEELGVPGVRLTRVAQLPRTVERLAAGLDPAARAVLSRTPVDVVLSRQRGTALTDDDEETGLARDLTLPASRDYRAYAIVRPSRQLPEKDLDTLAGAPPTVTAASTSRAFGLPTLRASQALDGKRDTAWLPGEPTAGQALEITAPRRRVDHVDVTQAGGGTDWITRVRLELDGELVAEAAVGPGRRRIRVAPQTAERLRLTVLDTRSGKRAAEVRVSEVDFAGARIRPSAARAADACVPVATVDGRPLLMRPVQGLTTAGPELWAGCGPVRLAAGDHSVRPVSGWQPDELVLRDPLGDGARAAVTPPGPRYAVEPGRGPRATVRVSGAAGAWYLMSGQAYDPRWRASVDGVDLGPPVLVDGYAAGWRVEVPGTEHTARIWYGPQRVTDAGLLLSGAAVLGCLALLLLRAPPRPFARLRARARSTPAAVAAGPPGPTWVDGPGWTAPEGDPAVWSRADLDAEWHPGWFGDVPAGAADRRPARPAAGRAGRRPGRRAGRGVGGRRAPAARRAWVPGAESGGPGAGGAGDGVARWRAVAGWAAATALAWLLGGPLLAAAAVAVAGWHLVRPPGPRTVIAAGAVLLAAVPVAWLAARPELPVLTARVVADNPWPHRLAAVGLLLLAAGVLRAERGERAGPDPDPEEARE